jgi:thiamine-phosphate pyrophosphorylase
VHLSIHAGQVGQLDRYHEARSVMGGGAIVGVDAGCSRHLAMELGEAGADYIGFSRSDRSQVATVDADQDADEDEDVGPQSQDTLIAWWSEVFEVPCVALDAPSPDDVRVMARLGADFVTTTFGGGEAIAASVERLRAMLAAAEDADVG